MRKRTNRYRAGAGPAVATTAHHSRNRRAEHFVDATLVVLIITGHGVEANLRRKWIDPDELAEAIREQGPENVSRVKWCSLEVDGALSVVPEGSPSSRTRKQFRAHRAPNA